ncbi:MAG TPA: DUF4389 domain-containing protein [Gaiellaceae bacterium]|jgi:hypothetical protein|nr:DUF4389 domain-containing protein [Gaiellaceae bacterium]
MDTSATQAVPEQHPVRLVVTDDLRRHRLTALALPALHDARHGVRLSHRRPVPVLRRPARLSDRARGRPPEEQSRLTVFFRFFLALPALLVAQLLRYLSQLLAVFNWITAVLLGRVPRGIRDFAAFALRFEQQTNAYLYLLTGRYPGFDLQI